MSGRFTTTYPFPIPPPRETDGLAQPIFLIKLENDSDAADQRAKEESSNPLRGILSGEND
jgi:hypothetical protein